MRWSTVARPLLRFAAAREHVDSKGPDELDGGIEEVARIGVRFGRLTTHFARLGLAIVPERAVEERPIAGVGAIVLREIRIEETLVERVGVVSIDVIVLAVGWGAIWPRRADTRRWLYRQRFLA